MERGKLFILKCVCVWHVKYVEVRGQPRGVSSLLPRGVEGSKIADQVLAERAQPSPWPHEWSI